MCHSIKRKRKNHADHKPSRVIISLLTVMLMLTCTACSNDTEGSFGNGNPSDTGAANHGSSKSNETINIPLPDDSDNVGDGNGSAIEDTNNMGLKKTAQAYREILEAIEFPEYPFDGGVYIDASICINDICGDRIPELLYITQSPDQKMKELHIWTYNGEPVEILSETILDSTQEYGAGSYGVVTSDDGGLYIYQSSGRSGWGYQIYYRYEFDEEKQQYTPHHITSSSNIIYMRGFEIFDGYSTGGWDDLEKYDEQVEKLLSNTQYFLFDSGGFLDSSHYIMENLNYQGAMECLGEMEHE